MTPDVMSQSGLVGFISEGTRGTLFVALLECETNSLAEVIIDKMAAQIESGKVAVVADLALGELFVLGDGFVRREGARGLAGIGLDGAALLLDDGAGLVGHGLARHRLFPTLLHLLLDLVKGDVQLAGQMLQGHLVSHSIMYPQGAGFAS